MSEKEKPPKQTPPQTPPNKPTQISTPSDNKPDEEQKSDDEKTKNITTDENTCGEKKEPTPEDQKKKLSKNKQPIDPKLEAKKKEKKEQLKKELEERIVKSKEEMAKLAKYEGAKTITDEVQFEKEGYEIHRNQLIATGHISKLYKGSKKREVTEICVKLIILESIPRNYSQNVRNALKVTRYVGQGGGQNKAPICVHFPKVFEIFSTSTKTYIYLEQFQTLSLHTRIKTKDTITEFDAKKWGKQLAEAIDCLQLAGIAHRNIRSENIIFDNKYDIKLVGFDLAVIFSTEEQQTITQTKYIPKQKEIQLFDHLPPQVLKEDYDPSSVDVWSWGVFVCLCINKQNPFDPKSDLTIEEQWNQYSTKFQFTPESKQLLDKCFVSDATSRIKSNEILRHKWLAEKKKKKT